MVVICFLVNFFISILYFIFFCFSSYLVVLMEEHSIEYSFASIEAKLDLLLHQLGQRIHNDSLMEQGVALSREFKPYILGGRRTVSC